MSANIMSTLTTYQPNGKMAVNMPMHDLNVGGTSESLSFGEMLVNKMHDAVAISKSAEQSVEKYHKGEITQIEQNMLFNEASSQLTEAKKIWEMMITALQDVQRTVAEKRN